MIHAPFTAGPLDAQIAFVGEAAGVDEAAQGGAFVGRAGKQANKLFQDNSINRASCRFDNVFQFHPKDNDLTPYIEFKKNKVVTGPIYDEHVEALRQRLLQTSANVIVAFGNVPLWALCGKRAITKQRGSILESTLLPGRKVIPTIHPAALLPGRGDYLWRYYVATDLKRIAKQAEFPEIKLRERHLILSPHLGEIKDFLQRCRKQELVAYDIEVKAERWLSHISFALSPDEVICIPFVGGATDCWTPSEETQILTWIGELLEDRSVMKLAHNMSFDATFMYSNYGFHVVPVQDTMIAAGILFPEFRKALDFLTSMYCDGEPYYKDDGKTWFKNPFGSEEIFKRYNAMDSAVLMEIFPKQLSELSRTKNRATYDRQVLLVDPLVYAGNKGIPMAIDRMEEAAAKCRVRIQAMEEELVSIMGPDFNANSAQQVMHHFYIIKGIKPYTKRVKGGSSRPTGDEKALLRIAHKGYREAQLIIDIRKERKLLGTYYEMTLDPDNRLRCSFNPVGTDRSRISSSKTIRGTGGNMQNQPPDMQTLMYCDPGYIAINHDLGQAENRIVAVLAGEERMLIAFENNIDIHSHTASLILGIPFDEVTREQRQEGKTANHGLNYDLGAVGFARQYETTEERAQFLIERYHSIYPGIREYHSAIRDTLSRNSMTLVNIFGRHRTFRQQWGHEMHKTAYNYIPSSSVAEKLNNDGVRFLYERQDLFPECQFLNTIHDSVKYQVPLSVGLHRILQIIITMKAQLETPLEWRGREFVIPVDTQLGFTLDEKTMLEWKAVDTNFDDVDARCEELRAYVEQAT